MLERVLPMKNPIQHYPWGSRIAIAELLGIQNPEARPMAELWMGAHPKSPSTVLVEDKWIRLDELIRSAPGPLLGTKVIEKLGETLPFLFKVLAAAEPLSIQAHPNKAQAIEGFEREERLGIPLDAPHRNYRDKNHKPELLCAMTPFEALKGFRPLEETIELLNQIGTSSIVPLRQVLEGGDEGSALRAFFTKLMRMDKEDLERILADVVVEAERLGRERKEFWWVVRLHEKYPSDPGVLSPLFLNLVTLAPGEAIYLPAGQLHAYLGGMGIEIMASSDNVLRGGLTTKHMDVDELLKVVSFASQFPEKILPREDEAGIKVYLPPAQEFRLSVVELPHGGEKEFNGNGTVKVILCTQGSFQIEGKGQGKALDLSRGNSVLVPAAAHPFQLKGKGTCYMACVNLV